jgi:hypothetical protein
MRVGRNSERRSRFLKIKTPSISAHSLSCHRREGQRTSADDGVEPKAAIESPTTQINRIDTLTMKLSDDRTPDVRLSENDSVKREKVEVMDRLAAANEKAARPHEITRNLEPNGPTTRHGVDGVCASQAITSI